jgi:RNA polymerase sigma factor for flagellar operon FliA
MTHEEVVKKYLPLVKGIARRVASTMPPSVELDDLVQDGSIGLIDAANRFDESRGLKFYTFAQHRILGAVIDCTRRESWPRYTRRLKKRIESARCQLAQELGTEPTLASLAERLNMPERKLEQLMGRFRTLEMISSSSSEGIDQSSLPAILVPSKPESPLRGLLRKEQTELARRAMMSLKRSRDRKVIYLYFFREMTMKEISRQLGLKETRISQLFYQAISEMRQLINPTT